MPAKGFEPPNLQKFLDHVYPDISAAQRARLLLGDRSLDDIWRRPEPQLRPIPDTTRSFLIRVDLLQTKPPVWRRILIPGDLTLPRLHEVLQVAMGWTDSHLHRFRAGNDRNAPEFLTQFDLDEGDEGLLEDDVRLDQILAAEGDLLWYEYDFGDGWQHALRVEKVLDTPPRIPTCVGGRLACPPEDCGGVWGYSELAEWVRSDYDDALKPPVFGSAEEAHAWLPEGWHPDRFDLEETNELIATVLGDPAPVTGELASLLALSQTRGARSLGDTLAQPAAHGPIEISTDAAATITEPFRVLLEVIGDGASLTSAGYLKPADVEQIAQRTGITDWWIGKANREDLTPPVASLRATARSLALISVRKGRVTPTREARGYARDPQALLRHIIDRLPLGTSDADRHGGWVTLAVVGSETPAELWEERISAIMFDLGWRDGRADHGVPSGDNPTLEVLRLLAGASRTRWRPRGIGPVVAAAARAAMRT